MSKESLRKHFLEKRQLVTNARRQEATKDLLSFLPKIFSRYEKVFSFMSFKSEIDLLQINQLLLKENKLYLPAVFENQMEFYKLQSFDDLEKSSFGFLSPKTSFQTPAVVDQATLILVPGVAFDLYGHRLGFGKGHYDEFFSRAMPCKKIAVAYKEQLYLAKLPYQDHDRELDAALFF